MNFFTYLTDRPKLMQFSVVLIVFFILMSMTGEYHDLMVQRDSFAKAVNRGNIVDSVGFFESLRTRFYTFSNSKLMACAQKIKISRNRMLWYQTG